MMREELMIGDIVRVIGCPNVFHIAQMDEEEVRMREHPNLVFPYYNLKPIEINRWFMECNGFRQDRPRGIYLWKLTENIKLTDDFGIWIFLEKVKFKFAHELQHFLRMCGESEKADNLRAI